MFEAAVCISPSEAMGNTETAFVLIVYGDCLESDEYVDGTSMTRETVGRHIVEYAMDGGEGNHNEDVEVHIDGINCGLIIIYYTLRAPSEAMQESAVRAIATNEYF